MDEVDAYIASAAKQMQPGLNWLRGELRRLLPDHVECLSYAMPGFRQPGKGGKMVAGYAGFAHHIGLYPHSGSVIAKVDCTPFQTSKSGVMFKPDERLPLSLIAEILAVRQAELAAGYGKKTKG